MYSTPQAAELVGISRMTLLRWIATRQFRPPRTQMIGNIKRIAWSRSDVARLRKFKEKRYNVGRGKRTNLVK